MNFNTCIKGHVLEYVDDGHRYTVDGEPVPSITTVMKVRFGNMYNGVDKQKLQETADYGTAVHEAVEQWCKHGTESDLEELRNFKFLMKKHKFEVYANEVPVILFVGDIPVSAGRLDLVLTKTENDVKHYGIADIKVQSALKKEPLAYQLNLYRIAYQQCYDTEIDFLRGVQIKGQKRKYADIPINEEMAWDLVKEYINE